MARSELVGTAIALATACLCLLVLAATARGASTRYAAYDGSGSACAEADPCEARTAVNGAVDGDTVVLLYSAGHDYEINPSNPGLEIDHAITVRGEPGQPRPTIHAPASGFWPAAIHVMVPGAVVEGLRVVAEDRQALLVSTAFPTGTAVDGSVVRDVVLEATEPGSSGAVRMIGASTLERATVLRRGSETHDALVLSDGPLVRDSVIVRDTSSSGGLGIRAMSADGREIRLRNLSVFGVSGGIFAVGGPFDLSVRNSIVTSGGNDIGVSAVGGNPVHVTVTHSSLDPTAIYENPPDGTVSLVAPNQDRHAQPVQVVDPLFPALDLHQLASSPTIDAGSADAFTGSLDIDGEPRLMGDGVDIGADEFRDAEPPETAIGAGPAEGSVVRTATPSFEFSSPAADLAGFECSLDAAPFAPCGSPFTTAALADGAHGFRVRAIDVTGHVDPTPATRGFKVDTSQAQTPAAGGPKPPARRRAGDRTVSVKLRGKRLKLRGRRAFVRLACPAAEVSPPCAGSLVLQTAGKVRLGGKRRRLTLAKARFKIAPGRTKRVPLRFSKRAARVLPLPRARRVRAVVRVHDAAGNRARFVRALRLLPPRRALAR